MKYKEEVPEIFICECSSREHQIVMQYDEEDNSIYCHIHLTKNNFWNRLIIGIKYIFGYKSRYGQWDEFIWMPSHVEKLKELFNKIKQ